MKISTLKKYQLCLENIDKLSKGRAFVGNVGRWKEGKK